MSEAPCATPGCVALASDDGLCTIHAGLRNGRIVPVEPPAPDRGPTVEEIDADLRKEYPRLRRFVTAIQVVALPIPVLMTYAFHSPFATILVARELPPEPTFVPGDNLPGFLVYHVFHHLPRQVRRYRRRQRVGVVEPLHLGGPDDRYVTWDEIDACRTGRVEQPELGEAQLVTLAAQTGPCQVCNCDAADLSWLRYQSAPETWHWRAGKAGWMAVCDPCREQVAFFLDMEN